MIARRNDYKYVAGDLFARSAATGDYLVLIDGTNLHTRDVRNSLVRGEDICWIWECINTRRAALFHGGDPSASYSTMPYQFRRADSPFANHADKNVIDNMVSAFNGLLTSREFTWPPRMVQTIWHHQSSVPDDIFLPPSIMDNLVVSMPRRQSYSHLPYDVWQAIADMESRMPALDCCCRAHVGSSYNDDCDWSGFATSATITPVGSGATPDTEASLENNFSRCIQAYRCSGYGDMDGRTNPEYWYANVATAGTIKVLLPYVEHVKSVYPIYHLHSESHYFASFADGRSAINDEGGMNSVVVSTTPRTMDMNHVVEISPAQEIMQACPLSTLASEMNLQHGFAQNVPTDELSLEITWWFKLTNLSLIIEFDRSVCDHI